MSATLSPATVASYLSVDHELTLILLPVLLKVVGGASSPSNEPNCFFNFSCCSGGMLDMKAFIIGIVCLN